MSDSPTLTIRGQHSDDWESLYVLLNEKDIIRDTIDDLPYAAEDGFRERINAAANTHTLIAEVGQPSGRRRIIGAVWLHTQDHTRARRRHIGQLNMVIHPDYRGAEAEKSLLSAALDLADNWLGLRRTEVVVYADNESAAAFYEQAGFEREVLMRRFAFRAGDYSDAYLLARRYGRTPDTSDSRDANLSEAATQSSKAMGKDSKLAITVRGCEVDDWEDVAAVRDSGNVVYYTLQLPYMSRDSVREKLENMPDNQRSLVAVVKDQVVGQLGLRLEAGRRAHTASLGMMVHVDYQGRGVGSALMEAAVELAENWLNISRIELEVYPDNAAGIALYQKFGFAIEGTLHDYAFRAGRYVDSYRMARVRDEV